MRFDGVKVTYYGHSAFKLVSPTGKVVLIDPWLDNPLAPSGTKSSLDRVDLILVTHGHGDHLGNTVEIARKFNSTVLAIYEISNYLASQGVSKAVGMNKDGTYVFEGIKATMVDATHSSTIDTGRGTIPGGEAAGFIVEFENGFKVYHTGDTGFTGVMPIIGDFYKPDLLMIPIGGLFTLGPESAAYAVKLIKPRWIIPMHYRTFPPLTGTPEAFREALDPEYREKLIVLSPGETAE